MSVESTRAGSLVYFPERRTLDLRTRIGDLSRSQVPVKPERVERRFWFSGA